MFKKLMVLGLLLLAGATQAADWSKPVVSDTYTAQVGYYKNRDTDVALMFDPAYTSPTNVPTNAIRFNSASGVFQRWNGSTWTTLTFNGGTALSSSSVLSISGITATGTTGLRASNNAGGHLYLIDPDSGVDTDVWDLYSSSGVLSLRALSDDFGTASEVLQCGPRTGVSVSQCQIYSSLVLGDNAPTDTVGFISRVNTDFLPSTDNTRDLGTAALSWRNLYVDGSGNINNLNVSGPSILNGSVTLGDASGDLITVPGRISGHVLPATANTYDLGSIANYYRNGYFGTLYTVGTLNAGISNVTGASTAASYIATGSCASGFTRDAPGHCIRNAYVSPTVLTYNTCTAVTLPSGATGIEIWSESVANAAASTGTRSAYTYAYTENTCTTLLAVLSNAAAYEFSSVTANTDLSIDTNTTPIYGATIYVRLNGTSSGVSTGRISIMGYWTNN